MTLDVLIFCYQLHTKYMYVSNPIHSASPEPSAAKVAYMYRYLWKEPSAFVEEFSQYAVVE
jgi:hypothetical protein